MKERFSWIKEGRTWLLIWLLIFLQACTSPQALTTGEEMPREPLSPLNIAATPSSTPQSEKTPAPINPLGTTVVNPTLAEPSTSASSTTTVQPPAHDTPTPIPFFLLQNPPGSKQNKIQATLDIASMHLSVAQELIYTNPENTVANLQIVAEAGRITDTLSLRELSWLGGMPVADFALDQGTLTIQLPRPLNPGESVGLSAVYDIALPALEAPLGHSPEQINLGDWHLFFPPYDPQRGWLIHEPANVGEHLVYDLADYDVDFQITGMNAPLVMAASAPAAVTGENQYHFAQQQVRNFSLALSPLFEQQSAAVDGIQVTVYHFPEETLAAKVVLNSAVKAVELFEELYGPYPHQSLSIVPANFRDGMEYDGLVFLDRELFIYYNGTDTSYLPTITAHEVAHQWWYGMVANDQALEPWLDEPLATYSELLFFERFYPDVVSWWWDRRINYYEPEGQIDGTIYDYPEFRPYVDAVYLHGAHFIHEIRLQLGDEDFLEFLRTLIDANRGKRLTGEIFWRILTDYLPEREIARLRDDYFITDSGS